MRHPMLNLAVNDLPDGFDFKAECKLWWDEFNNERAERDGYY